MKNLIVVIILLIKIDLFGQNAIIIKPNLELKLKTGTIGLFESDLYFVRKLLNNENITVKNYSFLPNNIQYSNGRLYFFDELKRNLLVYDTKQKLISSLSKINVILKSIDAKPYIKPKIVNIDNKSISIFLNGDVYFFDISSNKLLCKVKMEDAYFARIDPVTNNFCVMDFSNQRTYSNKCQFLDGKKNKRTIYLNDFFLSLDDTLYNSEILSNGFIEAYPINQFEEGVKLKFPLKTAEKNFKQKYCLMAVTPLFLVWSTNYNNPIGTLVFTNKKTGNVYKVLKIDSKVLNDDIIDYYDIDSDDPSPDVSETRQNFRICYGDGKYYIIFQSKGELLMYSFSI